MECVVDSTRNADVFAEIPKNERAVQIWVQAFQTNEVAFEQALELMEGHWQLILAFSIILLLYMISW